MTLLLERPQEVAAEVSVADRKFDSAREVNMMTVTSAFDREIESLVARPLRSRGASRLATRLGVALVKWGRKRAALTSLDHEEQARRIATERAISAATALPDVSGPIH